MATKLYMGLQGHGKTYEVCSVVIYEALKIGRRVVSNIAGLNQAEYEKLLTADGVPLEKIGQILQVSHDDVLKDNFWLADYHTDEERKTKVLQAGDLLVLDEVWRFWDGFGLKDSEGNKRPKEVMNFFRMQRQFVHPVTGYTCDVALITQDHNDLHRSVLIEESYRMTMLLSVGSSSRYRVDVFPNKRITKTPSTSYQKTYEKKYFALYKSHSQKKEGSQDAKQVQIDSRGNVLKGKIFIVLLVLVVIGFFAFYQVAKFFKPKEVAQDVKSVDSVDAAQKDKTALPQSNGIVSQDWVIKGYYIVDSLLYLTLSDSSGAYRYVMTSDFVLNGLDVVATIDGIQYSNRQSFAAQNKGVIN